MEEPLSKRQRTGEDGVDEQVTIQLLATNDTHSKMLPMENDGAAPSIPKGAECGGLLRRMAKLQELRALDLPTLLLDGR